MKYSKNMGAGHRLFYVVGQLGHGGLERQLHYLLSSLDLPRYRPGIAVWDSDGLSLYGSALERLGVSVYSVGRRGQTLRRLLRLRMLIRASRPEVVHSYSLHTNFPAWFGSIGLNAIVVGSIRNDYTKELLSLGYVRANLSTRFPGILIANSANAAEQARCDQTSAALKRIFFVPNAVNVDQFPYIPPFFGSRFEILGIGRLYKQKNWQDTLYSLSIFDKKAPTDWRFRLCGDGPLKSELQTLAKRLSLYEKIEFLGLRTDIREILASSHVVVSSSKYEGTPNALLEAMSIGRPVVCTDVGDVKRLVSNDSEGFLVNLGDIDAMAAALLRLASDHKLLVSMGLKARHRIESELRPQGLMEHTLSIYKQLGWQG